jgi:sugar-specific transcriptional regulator TrmB
MDSQKTLINLGLSKTEARVYLAALELGESLHSALAAKAGVKRATLYYDVLPSLLEKGLITESIKGKRKYLAAQELDSFLESKKLDVEEAERLVPQLRSLLAAARSRPVVLLYEGVEGIKKVWFDHLRQGQPILEFVGIENIHPELQTYLSQHYIWERAKRRIPVQMLVSGPAAAGIFDVKTSENELREVRTIDGKLFPIPLSCDIYGDNVSFTLHRQDSEPIGLIIRSQEIATMMRSVFSGVWATAKE